VGDTSGGTEISATLFQPFASYATTNGWTMTLNSESTYDWVAEESAVPINLTASKIVKIGGNLVSVGGGLRYWADSSTGGPDGLGARFFLTFLFPK
jgi:hypothetical protein